METCKLRLHNISKSYGGVDALSGIDFELLSNGIHGLVGKNGAGKSTFVDILYGWVTSDTGTFEIEESGQYENIDLKKHSPITARERGIFLVPQEPPFALELTIEENFFMADPIMKGVFTLDTDTMKKKVQKTLDKFKLLYKPDTYVRDVSMEDRHLLYTALVVDLYKSDVVLLDEVTSALPRTKTKILFEYLNEVKKTKSIVLITHRIQEIIEICDYVTVFRDGKKITTEKTSNLDEYQLANMIVGEKVVVPSFAPEFYLSSGGKKEENVRVQSLSNKSFFQDISFINYKGEILGITGLLESGSSNLLRTISGVEPYDHGDIFFEGIPFHPESPTNSVKNGIIYGTNDRIHEGTFGNMSILDNLNEIVWENLLKGGVFDEKQQMENYNHYKEIYNIKADSPNDNILTLSGGNQQKILLSRLSLPNPKILVLDEPTKGIDVGAKYEILRILREKLIGTERSRSIIVNSSSISELMIICDRIIVMFAGGIRDTFERESFDENTIFRSIQGVK